jgi:hypothetical protein
MRTAMNQGVNQGDSVFRIQENNLRAYPEFIICPNCSAMGVSRAEQKCNLANVVFACCFTSCWFAWQIYKKKDLNCYDSEHRCSSCNQMIANYTACGQP